MDIAVVRHRLIAAVLITIAIFLITAKRAHAQQTPLVAIDVGHSKVHSGATSARGVSEFAFNKAMAEIVQQTLAQQVSTLLIGGDGAMIDLHQRTADAGAANANFFLSIHHDSAQPKYFANWQWQGMQRPYSDKFSGFSLFTSRKNPMPEFSLRCASSIGAALKKTGRTPSPHHAENIAGENREWADQENGVYYYDDLIVLKTATMPAVLLEVGVIVNRDEELLISDSKMRSSIAQAVALGLSQCGALK